MTWISCPWTSNAPRSEARSRIPPRWERVRRRLKAEARILGSARHASSETRQWPGFTTSSGEEKNDSNRRHSPADSASWLLAGAPGFPRFSAASRNMSSAAATSIPILTGLYPNSRRSLLSRMTAAAPGAFAAKIAFFRRATSAIAWLRSRKTKLFSAGCFNIDFTRDAACSATISAIFFWRRLTHVTGDFAEAVRVSSKVSGHSRTNLSFDTFQCASRRKARQRPHRATGKRTSPPAERPSRNFRCLRRRVPPFPCGHRRYSRSRLDSSWPGLALHQHSSKSAHSGNRRRNRQVRGSARVHRQS